MEEAGVRVGVLTPVGMYDIRGRTASGPYRFLMVAFLAGPDSVRDGRGGHHVDEVRTALPEQIGPHPTVMRILNDAGAGHYRAELIEQQLRAAEITMQVYPIAGDR